MTETRTVAVAMSGGVDSSVAAALLSAGGERTFGLMLRLWAAGERYPNRCCSPLDVGNARRAAAQLGIPFYVLDAQEPFKRSVVDRFISGYQSGITPNPCMACNREIRWGLLFDQARKLGATHLATGHYARVRNQDGRYRLLRGLDARKDQSYVLSVLGQPQLRRSLFPVGEYSKREVRSMAESLGLEIADRPDSQDLCFLGGADYRSFLRDYVEIPLTPGPILDREGTRLGSHNGLHEFTLGQRKGIGVSAPTALYVIEKKAESNALVVGSREELLAESFRVRRINWVAGAWPEPRARLAVQVRYRIAPAECRLVQEGEGSARVELQVAVPAVTPGQAAVFYRDEECLGGGVISR